MNRVSNCQAGSLRYIWRTGDTLKRVATTFGTTVSAMMEVNADIDFMSITAGTAVCVPSRLLTCPDSDLYAIQDGDTLASIAAAYQISVGALMDLNPYVEPTQLTIGQYICVPRAQTGDVAGETEGENCVIAGDLPDCASLRSAQAACTATDTVKCGQSLADILTKYGVSFAEFSALNPRLTLNALLPGQKYLYPLKACACSESGKYIIQPNDTLSGIAASFGITPSELLRRNPNLTPAEFVSGVEICVSYPLA